MGQSSFSEYRNQLYVPVAPNSPDGTTLQSQFITFFSGSVGTAGDSRTPSDGVHWLVNSSFGTTFVNGAHSLADTFVYLDWVSRSFAGGVAGDPFQAEAGWGPDANPDQDASSNLFEFAIGRDPTQAGGPDRISVELGNAPDGSRRLVLSFARRKLPAAGLEYIPEVSSDGRSWQTGDAALEHLNSSDLDGEFTWEVFRDLQPVSAGHQRLARLRVVMTGASRPSITLSSPERDAVVAVGYPVAIASTAGDATGSLTRHWITVDGAVVVASGFSELSASWVPSILGYHSLQSMAANELGFVARSDVRKLLVDKDDDTDGIPNLRDPRPNVSNLAPVVQSITFSSTRNFHTEGLMTVSVAATDADGDLVSWTGSIGGENLTAGPGSVQASWQPTPANFGSQVIQVTAKDPWGASSQRTSSVFLFRTPPRP